MLLELLSSLFYEIILPNSVAGALFILFIALFRQVTKRMSKGYVRILWILLIVELLAPPLLQGPFQTIRNLAQNAQIIRSYSSAGTQGLNPAAQRSKSALDAQPEKSGLHTQQNKNALDTSNTSNTLHISEVQNTLPQEHNGSPYNLKNAAGEHLGTGSGRMPAAVRTAAAVIWSAGAVIFCIVYLCQFLKLKKRTAKAFYVAEDGCWVMEESLTPFVMPYLMPKIYLPDGLTGQKRMDILAHERQHIKNMDHLIKCLAAFAAAVHWFNPFVWAAYAWIGKDLEMYCDECVMRGRSMEERRRYSSTLLQSAAESSGLSVMLYFGESDTENRIRHILFLKKPCIAVSIILVVIVTVCGTFFLTSKDAEGKEDENTLTAGKNDSASGKEENVVPAGKEEDGAPAAGDTDSLTADEKKNSAPGVQDAQQILAEKIKEQAGGQLRGQYYADYDGDGSFELFAVTGAGPAGGADQIWFASAQEVTCLMDEAAGYAVFNEEDQGIYETGNGQKLFIADCGTMGSTYFSRCYYVQSGKAYEADHGENILEQISGGDFKVYVDAYDRIYMDGAMSGHTRKPYYAKWTGSGFEEYKAQKMTFEELTAYEGIWEVLSQLDQLHYIAGPAYLRSNGLIQINAINAADDDSIIFENVTLAVQDDSVSVVEANRAEGLLERSSYGGIYSQSGIFGADEDDTEKDLLKKAEAALKLRRRMKAFAKAYFAGRADTVRKYLAGSYTAQVEVYDQPQQAESLETGRIKGLGSIIEGKMDECTLSLEFRVPGGDSFHYLSVWFVKEDGAWKAASYGLEK